MSALQRKSLLLVALAIFACSAYLLTTASPLLLVEPARFPGLPLGTLITWAGILSLPCASYLAFHRFLGRKTRLARVSKALMRGLLLLGAGWGFLSYGLAGNWRFNFSGQADSFRGGVAAGEIFWAYTISIVVITLLMSVAISVFSLFLNRGD
jgi:hypothetical protein